MQTIKPMIRRINAIAKYGVYLTDWLKSILCQQMLLILNAYILALTVSLVVYNGDISTYAYLRDASILRFLFIYSTCYLLIQLGERLLSLTQFQYVLFSISITMFGVVNVAKHQGNIWFTIAIAIMVFLVNYYGIVAKEKINVNIDINLRSTYSIMFISFVAYVSVVGGLTVFKYITYHEYLGDTSIFCQMFYYMSETALPFTTIERDKLLSHFSIHFSPIFYSILPGYLMFKSPIYLAIMKTMLLAAGIFPLYRICIKKQLSNLISLMISISYLMFPLLIASNIGDIDGSIINETYFYPVLIFWVFYFLEAENYRALWIFSMFTLLVKEDGPIIIASIGLYNALTGRTTRQGALLVGFSVVFFLFVTKVVMPSFGDGILFSQYYGNIVSTNSSAISSVLKAFIITPSYILHEIFTTDKVVYLLQMLTPLLFLPLISFRENKRITLIIPIVLTTLICINPSYLYRLGSHHNMAAIAILYYLTVLSLAELQQKNIQFLFAVSIVSITLLFGVSYNINKLEYIKYYRQHKVELQSIDQALERIPQGASVAATDRYSTKLTNRKQLYSFCNFNENCDYLVIDLRKVDENDRDKMKHLLQDKKYGVLNFQKNFLLILQNGYKTDINDEVYIYLSEK